LAAASEGKFFFINLVIRKYYLAKKTYVEIASYWMRKRLNIRKAAPAVILIFLFAISLILAFDSSNKTSTSNFYFGVEFAYSHNLNDSQVILSDLKSLVNEVGTYTNLFVIGIPEISLNETLLNESCDYLSLNDLHFIVLFTDTSKYRYNLSLWTTNAQQKYGDKFFGVYRIDEPGGKELDNATFQNKPDRFLNQKDFEPNVRNYSGAAQEYVDILGLHLDILGKILYPKIFTSDYGLYWFDYLGGYEAVFGQFVGNLSRQLTISLCRGAAQAQNKDWGVIITYKYSGKPYIESGQELYSDLTLAYQAGAKYAVVFDYQNLTQFGVFKDEHFEALKDFQNYVKENPQDHGIRKGEVAYVLPQYYGFGFRNPSDSIWGIWSSDNLSPKIWNDSVELIKRYGLNLDTIYDDPANVSEVTSRYDKLFFWNETIG
jgi:hypothetical protein